MQVLRVISGRSIRRLPSPLPASLHTLSVRHHFALKELPPLPDTLVVLNASQNGLVSLPSPLPSSLRRLDVRYIYIYIYIYICLFCPLARKTQTGVFGVFDVC